MGNINNIYMYMYMYMCTCTCTCICVHVRVHVYVYMYVYMYMYMYIYMYMYMYMWYYWSYFANSYNKLLLLLFTVNLSCHRVVYVNNYNSFTRRNVFCLVILLTIQQISQYLVCRMLSCHFLSFFLVFDNASSSA